MLKENIQEALNRQLNLEFYSSYLYLSMAAYFDSMHLKGMAHWASTQSEEEREHAMKVYSYIAERGGTVVLLPIEGPPSKWENPLAAFEEAYANEQKATNMINNLVDISVEEKDHATHIFMQWFVTEQVEEEAMMDQLIGRLKMAETQGLFMMDHELGQRNEA